MSLSVILAFLCLVKTFIEVKPHFFRSNVVVPGTFVDMVRYNFLMCSGSVQPSPEIAVSHGHVNCNKSSLRADKRTVRRLPFFFFWRYNYRLLTVKAFWAASICPKAQTVLQF